MSKALYNKIGGLRFWNEREILLRNQAVERISNLVKSELLAINPAWSFYQCEGTILTPESFISSEYTKKDIFQTQHVAGGEKLVLRAETTASSYAYARALNAKLPACIWQVGKSFRRETNDGASASKMRYNEFYQLEFQCIYSDTTKADYFEVLTRLAAELASITGLEVGTYPSDRLPSYSEKTIDLIAADIELASISLRNDYSDNTKVFEVAIGLDRLIEVGKK